jgi:hypothetical protein
MGEVCEGERTDGLRTKKTQIVHEICLSLVAVNISFFLSFAV